MKKVQHIVGDPGFSAETVILDENRSPPVVAARTGRRGAKPAKAALTARSFSILSCVSNLDGTVIVSFCAAKSAQPVFWFESKAGNVYPAEPADLESSGVAGINLIAPKGSQPKWRFDDAAPDAKFDKNVSPIWALPQDDTFYISSARDVPADASQTAVFRHPVTGGLVPVTPDTDYRFSILAATHRCAGRVKIDFLTGDQQPISDVTKHIDGSFLGGVAEADYDAVVIETTTPENAAFLRISVIKGPTTYDEDGFLFFAKPSLASYPINGPVRAVSQELFEQLAENGDIQIFTARLPVPEPLFHGRREPVALTVQIDGETRRSDDLDVNRDSALEIRLFYLEKRDVIFHGEVNRGGAGEIKLAVFVDGELSTESSIAATVGPVEGRISLAERHLDGRPHTIELRTMPWQVCLAYTFGIVASYLTQWSALREYAKGPFSLTGSPASVHHYRSFRAWAANADKRKTPDLIALNDELLSGFRKRAHYPKLSFDAVKKPKVSIVIPVHNRFEVTYFCLCALLFAYNDASFEVIVVDDGSTDATTDIKAIVSGITVVRHDAATGFVGSCNDGAAAARGEYLFFLNNDTELTAGGLDELIRVFECFNDVGIAGAKLVYPDGKLQEAGGIVWKNGNPWNYGRGGNPAEPQYSYLRGTDYVSGAALMIPKTIWQEVGGFSRELAPAYFEDADLAMKVRASGRHVVYTPGSVVLHYEGQSAGTDTSSGMKRFQEINRPKFKQKWRHLYSHYGADGVRPDLEKDRGVTFRVLMLDHAVPQIDSDAGSYAAFQEIRLLQSLGAKITFLPHNLAWLDRHTLALENCGVECLYTPFVRNIDDYLKQHAADFDLIYITRFKIADEFVPVIRQYAPEAKIALNLADLHFLREMREAMAGSPLYTVARAKQTRRLELKTIASVDLTLTYTDVESTVIQSHLLDDARVARIPWVVEANENQRPKFSDTKDILFLGGFVHDPNRQAVKFFTQSVMPKLAERLPGVRLRVAGSRPPEEILALASDTVEIVGYVDNLDTLFETSRVYVAPLLAGAGLKGKVIEGMAQGIPSVLSPIAAEGTGLASGLNCFIAQSPDEWVDAIVKLYTDEALWRSVGDGAKQAARTRFSFAAGEAMMREVLAQLDIFGPPKPGLHYLHARP